MQNDVYDFLEPKEREVKGDKNPITFQLWNGKSIDLLP